MASNDGHNAVSSFTFIFNPLELTQLLCRRDRIAEAIRSRLNLTPQQLNLAQVLESATWKGGREIAKKLRPESGGPPLDLESDGTVF